jgi:hypothetical protein
MSLQNEISSLTDSEDSGDLQCNTTFCLDVIRAKADILCGVFDSSLQAYQNLVAQPNQLGADSVKVQLSDLIPELISQIKCSLSCFDCMYVDGMVDEDTDDGV